MSYDKTINDLAKIWLGPMSHAEEVYYLDPTHQVSPWHRDRFEGDKQHVREEDRQYANRLRRLRLVYEMTSPRLRRFVVSCQQLRELYNNHGLASLRSRGADPAEEWLTGPSSVLTTIRDFLLGLGAHNADRIVAVLKAYLLCAREVTDGTFSRSGNEMSSSALERIRVESGIPSSGWLMDLAADLRGRPLRDAVAFRRITTILVNNRTGKGEAFRLLLEAVARNEVEPNSTEPDLKEHLYPTPQFSLVLLDELFENATRSAWQWATKTCGLTSRNYDVRWSLEPLSDPLPNQIAGPSASAAQALAVAQLLAAMPEKR